MESAFTYIPGATIFARFKMSLTFYDQANCKTWMAISICRQLLFQTQSHLIKVEQVVCIQLSLHAVWPDWAIYSTLGNFSKLVATIILPKLYRFFAIFVKVMTIFHFSSEIILGNFYRHLATFYWSHCWHALVWYYDVTPVTSLYLLQMSLFGGIQALSTLTRVQCFKPVPAKLFNSTNAMKQVFKLVLNLFHVISFSLGVYVHCLWWNKVLQQTKLTQ